MNPAPAKPAISPTRLPPATVVRPAIVALAAILLMACFSTEVADSDTWLHLQTGKYVVERHKLAIPDPFSFTTYLGTPLPWEETVRAFNLTHEWLAQTILYLSYAAGGFGGLVLLRALLMTTFCGFVGLWTWRRSHGFYRALGAAFVTAFIASYFTSDRPYQITYALIVGTILILESRRYMWALPPLFLFWANCHGGFFMGFVVLGIYCAESLWRRFRGKPDADERRLWLVTAVCVPFAFLNPNGFLTLYILLAYKQSTLTSSIYEWQKPALWPPSFLNLLMVAAAAVLVWQRKRTRPADWMLLALFGAAYLQAVRNSNLLGLVAPTILASYLPVRRSQRAAHHKVMKPLIRAATVRERLQRSVSQTLPDGCGSDGNVLQRSDLSWRDWTVAALLPFVIAVPFARGRAFQMRYAEWKYPAGAAEFLLSHHVTGPMFNTFDKGGYLVWRCWPEERSFIDGRGLNEKTFADYQRMVKYLPGTRELLGHYGIQVVVMNAFDANSGIPYVLPLALADPAEKEWKMVFADAGATIFMRTPPVGVQPLASTQVFTGMEAQCQAIVDRDPARPRCARSLGRLFTRLGDAARARRWQELYRNLTGSEP